MRVAAVVTILSLALPAMAMDESLVAWSEMKGEVAKAATEYLEAFSTVREREKWKARIKERTKERPLQDIALDWFFDNRGDIEDKNPKAVKTGCMFMLLFVETGTPPPVRVRERITRENLEELANYLRSEVANLKKQ